MDIQQALGKLVDGETLSRVEMRSVMSLIMEGDATASQIGGF